MNRLQKKCLFTTAGFHLLLVVVLLVGPGFFTSQPKVNGEPATSSTIIILPAPTPTPERPVAVPAVNPPVQNRNSQPDKPTNTPRIIPSLDPVVRIPTNPGHININHSPVATPDHSADDQDQRALAIKTAIDNLKKHFTTGTDVSVPDSGETFDPNYLAVVKAKYATAWNPAGDTAGDDANTKVSVTIGRDGTVISSRILNPSGDASVDASVQQVLSHVKFVAPFPDGAKEKQHSFIINFNLKSKRLLG